MATSIGMYGAVLALAMGCALGGAPPGCTTPTCTQLEQQYDALKNETCAKVLPSLPKLSDDDVQSFLYAYGNFTAGTSANEDSVMAAAQKILSSSAMQTFLTLPDSFSSQTGLDALMVKCAVLVRATPTGLALFAQNGTTEQNLVTQLLGDAMLMRDMLVAGGAASSEEDKGGDSQVGQAFGQAMAIWTKLQQASEDVRGPYTSPRDDFWDDRSNGNILRRLALGTALMHAVPIHHRYEDPDCDEAYHWCSPGMNQTVVFVDPVERYLYYESRYKSGDLDPAIEVLTGWEATHTTNSPSTNEDLDWLRQTMAIYRPDHITGSYSWRYAAAVKTEVQYGDPQCATLPGICDGHYAEIPAAGGVCGPRAFFGRFTKLAFGIPVWGATQPGHAAMTTWTPAGWTVLLGAAWPFCWWGGRSGPDWNLEAMAREDRASFQKVLRGGWVSNALGEQQLSNGWGRSGSKPGYGDGGTWALLMMYAKKLSVNGTTPTPRDLGTPVVATKVAALNAKWATPPTPGNITRGSDGTITIDASAFTSKNRSASVGIVQSMDEGNQIIHGGCASSVGPPCLDPSSSSWEYDVTAATAGTYYLTANITTWHPNQDLFVSVNGGKQLMVPVFYTVGWWNETQPLSIPLVAGKNTLSFTRSSTRELVFKNFKLYTTAPIVPKPPGNYTPTPPPPNPPPGDYIEIPADTTCVKQGIEPVPERDCSRACLALGFKSTGDRARPNISGCFVMTQGEYAGNCNYNTNTSATCEPPCTLFGSVVQSLCMRN